MAAGVLPDFSLLMAERPQPEQSTNWWRSLKAGGLTGGQARVRRRLLGIRRLWKIERRQRGLQFKQARSNALLLCRLEKSLDQRQEAVHGINGSLGFFLGRVAPLAVDHGDLEEC